MAKLVSVAPAPPDGAPHLLVVDGVPYCVVKRGNELRAFVAVCSHKDRAIVPLRMKKGAIVCPHHGATFDPDTGEVAKAHGNDIPTGLPPVDIVMEDGSAFLKTRRRHRKLLPKKARRKLAKET